MIAKMEDIIRRENELIRSFQGIQNVPEANDDLNNLQREKIKAFYEERGKAFIGNINHYGAERVNLTVDTVFTAYIGQMIYNFDADFIIPETDASLADMIIQWNSGGSPAKIIKRIFKRIDDIGGLSFLWS